MQRALFAVLIAVNGYNGLTWFGERPATAWVMLGLCVAVLAVIVFSPNVGRPKLVIDADGVRFVYGLVGRRYQWSQISAIEPKLTTVDLSLASGKTKRIQLSGYLYEDRQRIVPQLLEALKTAAAEKGIEFRGCPE
jgi:hypothetical protein